MTIRGVLSIALVAAPVLVGIGYCLAAALGYTGVGAGADPGASRIGRVLAESAVWRSAGWTLWIAAASTALATAGAVLAAALFRGASTTDRVMRGVTVLPLPVPHVVAGLIGLLILGQSGLLARLLFAAGFIDGPAAMPELVFDRAGTGLILSLAWKEFAFLAAVAFSALASDVSSLDDAARTLGASRLRAWLAITLPLLLRAMLPAIAAVFAFVLGSYEAAALLAPSSPLPLPVLTMERYFDPDLARRPDAYVLSLLGFMLAACAVAVHEVARTRWSSLR